MCILRITKPKNYSKRKIIHAFLRDIMAELISKKIFDSEINTKIDTKISIKVFLLKINYN